MKAKLGMLVYLLAMGLAPWLSAQAADPAPAFVEKRITAGQFKDILKGGFVLYLRHGYTDNSRGDRVPSVDLNDCSTQRTLSDEGRELMKRVGKSMRDAKVPLNEILASPMCRTKESAQLAIGDKFTLYEPLMYSANMTSEEKRPRIEALKKLLAAPVPAGGNRLLVAHAPNLADLIGFFVKPEGNVVVFRPLGTAGYEYIGSIHPGDWSDLAK